MGQVIAESLRLYGARFWAVLPLGLAPALLDQVLNGRNTYLWLPAMLTVGAVLLTAAYVRAGMIVLGVDPPFRHLARAFGVGFVAFLPFPFLMLAFILPGVAWLALVGLCVPVVLVEDAGFVESFRRAVRLARADYVHALGSLATLVIRLLPHADRARPAAAGAGRPDRADRALPRRPRASPRCCSSVGHSCTGTSRRASP